MTRQTRAVRGAYHYARTDIPCPTCGAEPFAWCIQPGGITRHMPCIARLIKTEPTDDDDDESKTVARLRREMADAHPDAGGDPVAFREAHARYTAAKARARQ